MMLKLSEKASELKHLRKCAVLIQGKRVKTDSFLEIKDLYRRESPELIIRSTNSTFIAMSYT